MEEHSADRARKGELLLAVGYWVLAVDLAAQATPLTATSPPAFLIVATFMSDPAGAELIRRLGQLR